MLIVGAQGAVRRLAGHGNAGLHGGFAIRLVGRVVLVVSGLLLAGWGSRRPAR